ncbi:MAG: response regulator [Chitinophaga sp.]|uniref:hybrid sensor histidine kinase/response regulator n=1 Tax=Chitinophaga sp. TaxID=1869181 RepID=UPI001B0CB7F9|nr:hybrid sensor histidine kinase/response regulator [Chitinophaga sp.]MBO9728724.1 response regulator [Chitinophaga sp.]
MQYWKLTSGNHGFKEQFHSFISAILNIGTSDVSDSESIKRIRFTNAIGASVSLMVCVIAPIYFAFTHNKVMLAAAAVDALVALSVLPLNHYKQHLTASLVIYFLQCFAVLAFGVILGGVLQLQFMIVFLITILYLMFKNKALRIFCLVSAILTLAVLQTIYYLNSVELQPIGLGTGYIIQSLALAGVLFLILVVSKPYVHSNDYYPELERANRFKKIFIYQISHELRNSLNQVYLAANLLKQEALLDENLKKNEYLIDMLRYSSIEAKNIVNNVLSMSRIESGMVEPTVPTTFYTKAFFEKSVAVYRLMARSRTLTVKLMIDNSMPEIMVGDPLKLNEVINNLMGNAIKYAHKNSTIYLRITGSGKTYHLEVTNKGESIPMEKLTAIFDPFVTNKSNRNIEGTGVGLSLVKRVVTSMGGKVAASSPMPEHTMFTVVLPLQAGKAEDIIEEEDEMDIFDCSLKIVLAEDNEMNSLLLSKLLQKLGCKVITTPNGQEALEAIEKHSPDLIILDSEMPVMNGEQTLLKLKADNNAIPVIIATADAFAENQGRFTTAGAAAILSKPIEPKELAKVLNQHVKRRCDDLLQSQ